MNDLPKHLALRHVENLQEMLKEALPRIDPSTDPDNFERACALYAQTVIVKLRLSPTTPSL